MSTCSVYGSEPNKVLTEETNAYAIDFYGITKSQQEKLIIENIEEKDYVILRLGTAHGLSPRMRYDLVVNSFVANAMNTGEITVFGGVQKLSFVHIKDVARAVLMEINTHDLHGVYNFANENVSIRGLASFIKDKINCSIAIRDDIADKRDYIADNSKILKTGFVFEWNIEKSIDEISKSETVKEFDKAKYHNSHWLHLKKMNIKL